MKRVIPYLIAGCLTVTAASAGVVPASQLVLDGTTYRDLSRAWLVASASFDQWLLGEDPVIREARLVTGGAGLEGGRGPATPIGFWSLGQFALTSAATKAPAVVLQSTATPAGHGHGPGPAIPEPGTLALMGAGLAGLALRRHALRLSLREASPPDLPSPDLPRRSRRS